jgi:hypothetical protein
MNISADALIDGARRRSNDGEGLRLRKEGRERRIQIGLIRLLTETSISKCNLAIAGQRLARSQSRSLNLNSKCLDSLSHLRPAHVERYIHEACEQASVRKPTYTPHCACMAAQVRGERVGVAGMYSSASMTTCLASAAGQRSSKAKREEQSFASANGTKKRC